MKIPTGNKKFLRIKYDSLPIQPEGFFEKSFAIIEFREQYNIYCHEYDVKFSDMIMANFKEIEDNWGDDKFTKYKDDKDGDFVLISAKEINEDILRKNTVPYIYVFNINKGDFAIVNGDRLVQPNGPTILAFKSILKSNYLLYDDSQCSSSELTININW